TLSATGLVGIVRVVLRTRQHVAALLVHDGLLMLETMRYAEELRPARDLDETEEDADDARGRKTGKRKGKGKATSRRHPVRIDKPAGKATPAEIKMATRLVEDMRETWKPEEYKDEHRHDVMAMIQKKVKSGKTHEIISETESREARAPREVVDLMPLLKQSLTRRARSAGSASGPRAKVGRATRESAEPKRRRRA
ncbi:MAG: Ku protein, partial [Candidatus Eisenbacteria bacterium]